MRYLLDTNTCISVMRNEFAVLARLSAASPDECAISTITSYELYTGVEKCADPSREATKVARLLQTVHTLPFDPLAAQRAAQTRAKLEFEGAPSGLMTFFWPVTHSPLD